MLRRLFITILLILVTGGCSSPAASATPVVDVITPPDNTQYAPGEGVTMRVAAASNNLVGRIEVHAGGVLVAAADNPSPSPTYSAALAFIPTQSGNVKLVVTAIDASGQSSNPVELTIIVGTAPPQQNAIPQVNPGSSSAGTPAACKTNAVFVSDVTIPDNTAVDKGTSLVKTWRIRNTGECAWENGYVLAFQDGEQMGAPDTIVVAPTARDAAVDVSVPFTAPVASGTYTSTWRMRAPDGTTFGNRVYMLIRVP